MTRIHQKQGRHRRCPADLLASIGLLYWSVSSGEYQVKRRCFLSCSVFSATVKGKLFTASTRQWETITRGQRKRFKCFCYLQTQSPCVCCLYSVCFPVISKAAQSFLSLLFLPANIWAPLFLFFSPSFLCSLVIVPSHLITLEEESDFVIHLPCCAAW